MRTEQNSGVIGVVLVVLLLGFLFWTAKKDVYRPVYYPDKNDLTRYRRGPKFHSLDEAREWVYELNRQCADQDWDYEIGKNPKASKYGDIEICEETLK